jgi:Na+/H+ antiporter NhaD/arsenite permease-like protein
MTAVFPPAAGALAPFGAASAQVEHLGRTLPLWSAVPFVLLLALIAFMPLFTPRWWESNKNRARVAALLAVPLALYLALGHGRDGWHALFEALADYVSFIVLLGSLFVISGGIYVRGSLAGTPLSNVALLGIGAVLANLIGTTGASMVLVRPLLRANRTRERRAHVVVFFIFVVSNCGGLLTPLGDPPLYLGFLKGVPFEWTLGLFPQWVTVNSLVMAVFFAVDSYILDREELRRPGSQLEDVLRHAPLSIEGWTNALFLAAVVLVIIGKGQGLGTIDGHWSFGVQEALMIVLAALAYLTTKPATRSANGFSFHPIVEVAVLFAGIFVTMVAPLQILNARGGELGIASPRQYFWATGLLSSFLDNAPTYLAFAATACGQAGVSVEAPRYLADFLAGPREAAALLAAISCGAVLMGAMTYIGNGPNFMVKAIAEREGVRMPSFFGYMAWSGAVLLPVFAIVTWLFF